MNLHLMILSKTTIDFIKFLEKNIGLEEHEFIFWKGENPHKIELENTSKITILENKKDLLVFYLKLFKLKKYKRIFLHGWYFPRFTIPLFFNNYLLKKIYWIIWGEDLYSYTKRKKKKIFKRIEDYVKGNIKGYISYIKGEFKLVQKWVKATGKFYQSFTYPSNLYKSFEFKEEEKKELWIQIGNSGEETNNHFEILEKLLQFKDQNIKLFCILSYGGSEEYKKKVIEKGYELFSNKFYPIEKFMEFDKYMKFISLLDIAILAHNQQQAFGNIISLLSMKKTVYLKEEVTTYETLKEMGVEIKSFDKLIDLERFDENILENNRKIIERNFSKEKLIEQWKNILQS